jgi:hypothetical protein
MLRPWPLLLLLVPALAHADEDDDSKLPPLSVYGFARLDVLADDAKLSDVAQPMFVALMPAGQSNEGEMTMTPRLSRVGLAIDDWDVGETGVMKGDGKLEVDFAGGGGTNAIRLRQAYAQIVFADRVRLLAGQTEDLFSPLIPTAQNDTQLLFAGNIGDRRPQLRMMIDGDILHAGVALATTGTLDRAGLTTATPSRPMFQWLLEGEKRIRHFGMFKLGVSGHVAREELADGSRHGSSSVGIHAFVPIMPMLALQGEAYLGENAADIGGGIDQGVDAMTGHRIGAKGGWVELVTAPTKRHVLAFGASIDTCNPDDINAGDRERNGTVYGVVRYKPLPTLQLAAEYLYWKTVYHEMGSAAANRVDLHLSVFF